jgi:hypothetical protein
MARTSNGTGGLAIALCGVALVPLGLLIVALTPEGWRTVMFLVVLAAVTVVAGRGGWIAWQAFVNGAAHPIRAFLGATVGLIVAATAAMVCVWSAIGVAVG